MTLRRPWATVAGAWILIHVVIAAAYTAQPKDSIQDLGRRLYQSGIGVDGKPVVAVIESPSSGTPGVELPATALPCASCHGTDGRGRAEGGVEPTDLRPHSLTRPRQPVTPSGRRHPPYDERRLVRAVTMGLDPAGSRLESAMPRYRLSQKDAEALLAFWRTLGTAPNPGTDDQRIEIGVVLPTILSPKERARLGVLRAWRDQISNAGGIFGRRIELREISLRDSPLRNLADPPAAWIVLADDTARLAEPRRKLDPEPSPLGQVDLDVSDTPVLWLNASGSCPSHGARTCFVVAPPHRAVTSRRWQTLAKTYDLPREHVEAQLQSLAAAEALTSALEQSGRRLDTESLVLALRDPRGFSTSIGRIRLASNDSLNADQP